MKIEVGHEYVAQWEVSRWARVRVDGVRSGRVIATVLPVPQHAPFPLAAWIDTPGEQMILRSREVLYEFDPAEV